MKSGFRISISTLTIVLQKDDTKRKHIYDRVCQQVAATIRQNIMSVLKQLKQVTGYENPNKIRNFVTTLLFLFCEHIHGERGNNILWNIQRSAHLIKIHNFSFMMNFKLISSEKIIF